MSGSPSVVPARVALPERVFACVLLLLATGWPQPLVFGVGDAATGSPGAQIVWSVAYVVVGLLVLARRRETLPAALRHPLIWLLVGYVALSVLWSDVPGVTLRRIVALSGTTLAALYLAVSFRLEETLDMLTCVFGATLLASVLAAVIAPGDAVGTDRGIVVLTGVFTHRNSLGRAMAFGLILGLAKLVGRRGVDRVALMFSVATAAVLAMSGSKSALVVALGLVALWVVYQLLRGRPLAAAKLIPGSILLVIIVAGLLRGGAAAPPSAAEPQLTTWEEALQSVGREPTLTGRTRIWEAVLVAINHRPLLGYGYGAAWLESSSAGQAMKAALGPWYPAHAHNGFLDVTLELGAVGLALVCAVLLAAVRASIRYALRGDYPVSFFPLGVLAFTMALSLVESFLLEQNSIYWLLIIMLLFRQDDVGRAESSWPQRTKLCLRRQAHPDPSGS